MLAGDLQLGGDASEAGEVPSAFWRAVERKISSYRHEKDCKNQKPSRMLDGEGRKKGKITRSQHS